MDEDGPTVGEVVLWCTAVATGVITILVALQVLDEAQDAEAGLTAVLVALGASAAPWGAMSLVAASGAVILRRVTSGLARIEARLPAPLTPERRPRPPRPPYSWERGRDQPT